MSLVCCILSLHRLFNRIIFQIPLEIKYKQQMRRNVDNNYTNVKL